MSGVRQAYSSTVVSQGQLAAGVALAAVIGVGLPFWRPGSDPAGPLAGLVILVSAVYLATVRLAVGHGRIVLGHGPFGRRGRVIPVGLVTEASSTRLSLAQVYGFGVAWHTRTTRMTVRPGPALVLKLSTREHIRISTPDPAAACALIAPGGPGGVQAPRDEQKITARREQVMTSSQGNRPWFGPKRVGYGYRPQTWQGWAIIALFVIVVLVIVGLVA